jgi:hypothetical protein
MGYTGRNFADFIFSPESGQDKLMNTVRTHCPAIGTNQAYVLGQCLRCHFATENVPGNELSG